MAAIVSIMSGNWTSAATWVGSVVPTSADTLSVIGALAHALCVTGGE